MFKYEILQIKDIGNCEYAFRSYRVANDKLNIEKDYKSVYKDTSMLDNENLLLEEIWNVFNVNPPKDYEGRSVSISDIVVLNGCKYYCDDLGWVPLD